jgi:hypothetical protein
LRNRCSALNCVRHHSFTPRAVEFVGQSPPVARANEA